MPKSSTNMQAAEGKSGDAPTSGTGAIGTFGGAASGTPAIVHGTAEAAPVASGGLTLGATAYVRKAGGKNLRLHDLAGLESHVSDSLHPGTQLTLLVGPVHRDNYPWWRIRTADGREGWVAGTELVTHPE